jgi:hypothetical protein
MGIALATCAVARKVFFARNRFVPAIALCALLVSGCHHEPLIDTTPLDSAGMSYDAIQQLKAARVTTQEVAEFAKARQGGLRDPECVELLHVYRSRAKPFNAGATVVGLIQAGIGANTIIELARLGQLGLASGELQAMRLAGISDETILEVARHHAEGKTVLSGASLAGMKNAGLRDATLLELARRGIPDSQTNDIVALRRRGMNDAEILRHFTGS